MYYLGFAFAAMSQITREVKLDSSVIPPLDPAVLTLSEAESEFLNEAITRDDEQLKAKILEVQKLYASNHHDYAYTDTLLSA